MPDILVLNHSALLTAADIPSAIAAIAAINKQIAEDFAPVWNASGTVYFGDAPSGAWQFTLQDTIDDPDALGYHADDHGVTAIIDIAACKQCGSDWRTCLGHEVLEALADPLTTRLSPNGLYAVEVADPVEEGLYLIDGVPVTNFVLPAYFGWAGSKFDKTGILSGPAPALSPGGYQMVLQNGNWTSLYGERAAARPGYMASRQGGRRAWRMRQTP